MQKDPSGLLILLFQHASDFIKEIFRIDYAAVEEFDYSVEGEAEVLARRRDDPRALMILAEADGEIVATSDVMPMGTKSRTLHRATLGMSVRKDYWRLGIGSAMM